MSHVRKYTLSLQHVFAGERLQAFSDAVFSIIVTFMVPRFAVWVYCISLVALQVVPLTSSVENVISDDTSEVRVPIN